MGKAEVTQAILVTYELVGQSISDAAVKAMVAELSSYPESDVLVALTRCRKELRRVTLADILDRIPGGHLGVEEAWAIVSRGLQDESISMVWTDEMAQAFGPALALAHDPVAARMAFKEAYTRLVQDAKAMNSKPVWKVSLGFDMQGRERALREAIEKGRIGYQYAQKFLPSLEVAPEVVAALPALRGMGR